MHFPRRLFLTSSRSFRFRILLAGFAFAFLNRSADAASVTVRPSKDNTIYGNADLSNGAGKFLFAGSNGANGGGRALRSLLAFDLAGQIPAGATINSVTLTLRVDTPLPS